MGGSMSKHLRGFCKNGTTFGMEVDGIRASKVMKKAEYITHINQYGNKVGRLCIKAPLIASLMGDVAWLITEKQDFTHVQFDDSAKYMVIYPENEDGRKMAQILGKALIRRQS